MGFFCLFVYQVTLELLIQLEWNYVAIVYVDDDYGRSAAAELRRLAKGRKLCVPVFESVPLDATSLDFHSRATSIAEQVLKIAGVFAFLELLLIWPVRIQGNYNA